MAEFIGMIIRLPESGLFTMADSGWENARRYLSHLDFLATAGGRSAKVHCRDCSHPRRVVGELIQLTDHGVTLFVDVHAPTWAARAVAEARLTATDGARIPRVPTMVGRVTYALSGQHRPEGWLPAMLTRLRAWPPAGLCPLHGRRLIESPADLVSAFNDRRRAGHLIL